MLDASMIAIPVRRHTRAISAPAKQSTMNMFGGASTPYETKPRIYYSETTRWMFVDIALRLGWLARTQRSAGPVGCNFDSSAGKPQPATAHLPLRCTVPLLRGDTVR